MKKIKNIMLLIIAAFMFGANFTIVEAAPSTVTVSKSLITTVSGRKEAKFVTSDGKYGYCITPSKTGAPNGTTFKNAGKYTNNGIIYLLNTKETNTNLKYFAMQLGIWKYADNYLPASYTNNTSSDYYKMAVQYANEAKSHSSYSVAEPTIKASASTGSMTISSDKSYYQSAALYANTTVASTYNVTVSGATGVYIVDANGNKASSFKSGAKFYVRVPATSITTNATILVTYTATGTYNVAYKYVATSGTWQDLVIVYPETKTVKTTTTLTVTPIKRVCEIFNGKYYDKEGKVTTETGYKQACFKHSCEKVGNKYYDKAGNETTEANYKKVCFACTEKDGKYYDKDGNETTEIGYKQACFTHSCEQVGDKYYDKSGKEVDETTYKQVCFTHTCEKVGDKYYDKDGNETDEANYKKVCFACSEKDGKYYDKDGNETTESNYNKVCFSHTCEKIDDTYFDKDGNEVSKDEYEISCFTNICKKIGDKYFGNDGKEVTEAEYNKQCVEVPDTGISSSSKIVAAVIGLTMCAAGAVLVLKRN